ncbi:hypothetical protein JKK62_01780 [Ruminococcus sp. M6(2020)]|uniref:Dockerin domain-containing protein n=2 Tax=Ruminococcus difficilis TaxID=2763069 RepID=A0A934TYB4_9FIRM|nr:hypothetical protein [Ruminococcus difficilis]
MMKKMITITITVMMLLSVLFVGVNAESNETLSTQNTILYGDADGDGEITIIDATRIQRHLVGVNPLISEENRKAAIVSGDDELSVIDVTLIQRRLSEIISRFPVEEQAQQPTETEDPVLMMAIDGTPVTVAWEDNEAVTALKEYCRDLILTIPLSMYGGFEQFGSIGTSLPRNDVQTTTHSGDIVLYSGDQIVVFYGSNSWAYTRLGHITDKSQDELTALLSNGDITISLSY